MIDVKIKIVNLNNLIIYQINVGISFAIHAPMIVSNKRNV